MLFHKNLSCTIVEYSDKIKMENLFFCNSSNSYLPSTSSLQVRTEEFAEKFLLCCNEWTVLTGDHHNRNATWRRCCEGRRIRSEQQVHLRIRRNWSVDTFQQSCWAVKEETRNESFNFHVVRKCKALTKWSQVVPKTGMKLKNVGTSCVVLFFMSGLVIAKPVERSTPNPQRWKTKPTRLLPSPTSATGPPSPKTGEGFWVSVATDAGTLVFAGQQQSETLREFFFSMREKMAVRSDEGMVGFVDQDRRNSNSLNNLVEFCRNGGSTE